MDHICEVCFASMFELHSHCDCGFALAVAAAQLTLGIEE